MEGLDADSEEMEKVLQMKVKKGTGGQVCYVRFQNGTTRWIDHMFVSDELVRDFQNEARGKRHGSGSSRENSVRNVVCACGKTAELAIHKGKTKNEKCKERNV